MTLTAFVFPKLPTLKSWLDKCLKSPVSEDPSTSNMVNMPKHCRNLHHNTFIIFIDHCQGNWAGKGLSYWHAIILGLLVNTLAADEKHLVLHRDNLTIPIQMQLSQKKKFFLWIFSSIFEISIKLSKFWINWWLSQLFYIRNYWLLKSA